MQYKKIQAVEQYMTQHDFLPADRKKIRDFLCSAQAVSAHLTRKALHYTDRFGIPGVIGTGQLGIQNNFR